MGQTKDVHVYYVLAEKTLDVNILEERKGKVLVERRGHLLLVEKKEKLETERSFGGLPFEGAACGVGVDGEEDEDDGEGENEEIA